MKTLFRIAAIICNQIENIFLRMLPAEATDQVKPLEQPMECPANENKTVYWFLVQAQRFGQVMSTQTRAVEISIDSEKYTKQDAEAFAAREFMHLDDTWTIRVTPMTQESYKITKRKFELSIAEVKGPAETYNKTNS